MGDNLIKHDNKSCKKETSCQQFNRIFQRECMYLILISTLLHDGYVLHVTELKMP